MLSCALGALILEKLFPSKLGEENALDKDKFDSSMNSAIIKHVQFLLNEVVNSQKPSGKMGLEVSKYLCYGNVTEQFWSCNDKCNDLSVFQRMLCNSNNIASYLIGCYSGNMECYTDDGDSGRCDSNCDYSTFNSSHTMNKYVGPAQSCGTYTKTGVSDDEINTILKTHNQFREKVAKGLETQGAPGPQPGAANMFELKWNCELAEVAQRWSEQCQLGNDIGDDRKICSQDYYVGQNVFKIFSFESTSACEETVNQWYSEVKDMPTSLVSNYSSHPDGMVIGHYTQIVWAGTYAIGCGGIHFPETRGGDNFPACKLYVCNYGPGGNLLGSQIYESGIEAPNCPNGSSSDYQGLCNPP